MAASPEGWIFDLRKYSVHDGPGIRTTAFFKGCPLRCAWCHNPEGQHYSQEILFRANRCIGCATCQAICPQDAVQVVEGRARLDRGRCSQCGECTSQCYSGAISLTGRHLTLDEFKHSIERDRPFYEASGGGVTFSGGEPLMQIRFLEAALRLCAELGIHSAVDTCGFASWSAFERIRPLAGLFLYDLKVIDGEEHRHLTGHSNELIQENLRRLFESGSRILVRIPIVPGINDSKAQLEQAGQFLAGLPALEGVDLLPYHASATEKYAGLGRSYPLGDIPSPTDDQMQKAARILEHHKLRIAINGINIVQFTNEIDKATKDEVVLWQ